jgi:GTPase SAR1 family protein
VIRVIRKVGKSGLVRRIRGEKFITEYSPTPGLESIEIPWRLNPSTRVRIRVWDVVEAFLPLPDDPKKPLPDATTVDTLKPANCIVIVLDIRVAESVALGDSILVEAPEDLPIVVFSNYTDELGASPILPAALIPHIDRFYYITGSFKTSQ